MNRSARRVASPRAVNVEDLRQLAKKRLPPVVFNFLDGGAEDEITMDANQAALRTVTFRPRYAVPRFTCDLRTTVLGKEFPFPILLAPVGGCRLMHPQGEVGAARAAGAAGTTYILASGAGHRLEDVKAASTQPVWYQLYLIGGRKAAEPAIERAARAGYSVLVLTIDTPVGGMRERDFRTGVKELTSENPFAKVPRLPQLLAHPRWLTGFLLDGCPTTLANVTIPGKGPMPMSDLGTVLSQSGITWEDFSWIREIWHGPIVVKGVLTADDARKAVEYGASAVVVSNHGGRQLDGAPASLHVLPEVVKAVGSQIDVLMDGGIRRGSDIVKAICLGARAVLIGRAYAYGLCVAGSDGVARVIEILRADIERTMTLIGCSSIAELNSSYLNLANSEAQFTGMSNDRAV